jgi:hypothetical protein
MVRDGDLSRVVDYIRLSPHQPNEIMEAVDRTSKKSALHFAAAEG